LFGVYLARHPAEAAMMRTGPFAESPRLIMACVGPIIGVISGVVIGLLSLVAWRIVRRPMAGSPATR
jgi:hypothetical protein